ncbi:MAG: Hsp70 family protein, partial [Candidatus Krumholzibacteriota bacterium]|nr:Hsp70 family protein [Candidatus Krumholzibacteriota bacterium]
QTEKNLGEYKDRLDEADAKKLQSDIDEIQAALKGDDADSIKSATDKLNATWQEVAQRMYRNAGSQPAAEPQESQAQAAAGGAGPSGGGEEVADADYEVIEDDEKK